MTGSKSADNSADNFNLAYMPAGSIHTIRLYRPKATTNSISGFFNLSILEI